MNFEFSPKKVLKTLFISIFILLIGNIFSLYLLPIYNYDYSRGPIRLLNFDSEQSFPTIFSFLILLTSSFLLFHIAKSHKKLKTDSKIWFFLAFVFMFLAFDEALSLHELVSSKLQKGLDLKGILFYAWIIPYGIILIIVLALSIKLLAKLPREITILFLLSGFIFVVGAIGLEMYESILHDSSAGKYNMSYNISYTIEETFEMTGISLFIYALLKYIIIAKLKPISIGFTTNSLPK